MSDSNPKFVPDTTRISQRTYANFAAVRTTGIDITISFCDIVPPSKEEVEKAKKGEEILIPTQCQVAIPISMAPSLIEALKMQYEFSQKEQPEKENKSSVEKDKSKR